VSETLTAEELRARLGRPVPPATRVEVAARMMQGRAAAVLVPIIMEPAPRVLLTRRADHLRHHGGQVSFPGGRIDPTDLSPEAAALREAWEEVKLDPRAVEIVGRLPLHETGTGFVVTPVVGLLPPGLDLHPEASEVADLLSLPVSVLLDPAQPTRRRMRPPGSTDWRDIYVWPHDDHYIWGATAAILLSLAQWLRSEG